MAVVVKKFRVHAGGRTYFPGEVISTLDKQEEKELVDAGYCEFVQEQKQAKDDGKPNKGKAPKVPEQPVEQEENGPDTSHPLEKVEQ